MSSPGMTQQNFMYTWSSGRSQLIPACTRSLSNKLGAQMVFRYRRCRILVHNWFPKLNSADFSYPWELTSHSTKSLSGIFVLGISCWKFAKEIFSRQHTFLFTLYLKIRVPYTRLSFWERTFCLCRMNTMLGSLKCEYPGLSPDVINSILDGIQASIRQKVKEPCHDYLGLSPSVIKSIFGRNPSLHQTEGKGIVSRVSQPFTDVVNSILASTRQYRR